MKLYTDLYAITDTDNEKVKDYLLYGDEIDIEDNIEGCDVEYLKENCITISPSRLEIINDERYCDKLRKVELK